MHQYFFRKNEEQFGPYSLEELKGKGLEMDTYVWYYGLSHWTKVRDIEHLREELFKQEEAYHFYENEEGVYAEKIGDEETLIYETKQNTVDKMANKSSIPTSFQQVKTVHKAPKSFILENIVITILCCFLPIGIIGIIYGSRVESLYYSKQFEAAEKYSNKAERWFYIATITNIIVIFFTFLYHLFSL